MNAATTGSGPDPDKPHGYKPRTLSLETLPDASKWSGATYYRWAAKDPTNRPCAVCGGSRFGLVVHNLPAKKPSLAKALAALATAA